MQSLWEQHSGRATYALIGEEWLQSPERQQFELRLMQRRVPLYRVTIAIFQALARLTKGPPLTIFHQKRLGINGEKFLLPKLQTMTERDGGPIQSSQDYRKRTSFLSRLARAMRVDEMPQIIEEVQHRKMGGSPHYSLIGMRPMNQHSHALIAQELSNGERELHDKWASAKVHFTPGHCSFAAQVMHDADVHGEGSWGSCYTRVMGDYISTQVASRVLDEEILRQYRRQIPGRILNFLQQEANVVLAHIRKKSHFPA